MKKKIISFMLAVSVLSAMPMPIIKAEAAASVSIAQDVGDYTYFNSNYHLVTTSSYAKAAMNVSEGNSVVAGAFDYQNPDKVKNIVMTKTAEGDCRCAVQTESRQLDFEQSKRYKHFGISTEFKVKTADTELELFTLKNRKTNTEFPTTTIKGTQITYADGSTGTIALDTWYTYLVSYNVETDVVEMYLNGSLVATSSFVSDRLDDVICDLEGASGSAELMNCDITGYEKAMTNGVPTKTSVFVDRLAAKQLLNKYTTAFHAYSGVYYADSNYKKALSPAPVYENGELYVSVSDFNAALGTSVKLDGNVLSNGSDTMECNVKTSGSISLIPLKKACDLVSMYTYSDGNGMIIVDDAAISLESNDHWDDVYNEQMTSSNNYYGNYFELSDVRMMNWYLLYERPTKDKLESTFNQNTSDGEMHPRLLINDEKIEEIKALKATDSYYASIVDGFISEADEMFDDAAVTYASAFSEFRTNTAAEEFETRVKSLAFAYLLTGNAEYAERAIQDLKAVCAFPDLNYGHIIDSGMWSSGLAFGYDWLYDYMEKDTETRDEIAEAIIKLEIEPVSRAYYAGLPSNATPIDASKGGGLQSGNAFARWKSNYGAYVNSGMIVSALAVAEENPDLCFDAIENALRSYEYVLCGFETGEWMESPRYWYSMQSDIAYTAGALMSVMGTDYKLLSAPGMKEQSKNIVNYTSLNSRFSYGDDSDSMTRFFSREASSFFADYYDLPELAMIRKIKLTPELRAQYGSKMMSADPSILDIVYYTPDAQASDLEAIPNVYVGEGAESFLVHENFEDPNALFFASAGGPTTYYHSHNDSGDFIFDLGGETWAYELGTSSYNAGWWLTRYASRAEGHNTLVINPSSGVAQQMGTFAPIVKSDSDSTGAYAVYDMTDLYAGANDVKRGFYITDDFSTVTVRDEISLESAGEGYWFMHTDADIEVVDNSLVKLTKNNKTLYMQFDVDGATSYEVMEMEAKHLDSSMTVEGETYNPDVKKVAVKFNGTDVNITARMALSTGIIDTTPISERTLSSGNSSLVFYEDFEDIDDVSDINFFEEDEITKPNSYTATSQVGESNANRYFEMELENTGDNATGAVYSKAMKAVTEFGIDDKSDFTVSYNVKFNPYDQETGTANSKYVEYIMSLGDGAEGNEAYRAAYAYYKATEDNNSRPESHGDCTTAATNAGAVGQYPDKGVPVYAGAWNNIMWSVHGSDTAKGSYADLYVNGKYSATLGLRNGDYIRRAVFAISLNADITYGKMAIDDIKIYEGSFDKADSAKNTEVKIIDTDFSEIVASNNGASDVSVSPVMQGTSKFTNDSSAITIEEATGKFGKSASDKAIYWHNDASQTASSTDSYFDFTTGNHNGKLYNAGDSQEIVVDFAFDETPAPLCISGYLYDKDYANRKILDIVKVTGDYVSILNNSYTYDLTPALIPGKWYRLRAVITAGDGVNTYNTMSVYIDGATAADGPTSTKPDGAAPVVAFMVPLDTYASVLSSINSSNTIDNEFDQFMGFKRLWLHYKFNNMSVNKGIYYDNLKLTSYIGGALPKSSMTSLPIMRSVNTSKYLQRGIIYTDSESTLQDILDMFDMARAKKITARDANGNEVALTEKAAGKYIEIESNDDQLYYVSVKGDNETIAEISNSTNALLKVDSKSSKSAVKMNGGRGTKDENVKVTNVSGNNATAYVDLFSLSKTYSDATAYQPITAEVSVMPVNNDKIEVQLYTHANTREAQTSGSAYKAGKTAVYFENGMIRGKNDIMPYETGKWYKVALTLKPGSQNIEVRINGELVVKESDYTVWKYPMQFASQLKLLVKSEAVFDDINIYNGKYIENEVPSVEALDGAAVEGGKIYLPEDLSISELVDYVDFVGTAKGIYSDDTLSEQLGDLEEGCVLVVENDGIYKEYPLMYIDYIYAQANDNVYSAEAVSTDTDAKLIIAEYKDGMLTKLNYGTAKEASALLNASAESAEKTVKVFLMNLETMQTSAGMVEFVNGEQQ